MKLCNSKYRGKTTSLLVTVIISVVVATLFMVHFSDQLIPARAAVLAPVKAEQARHFVDNKTCTNCHTEQAEDWLGSDHEKAMQAANKQTVLGDFNDVSFTDAGVTSRFFQKDKAFFINTRGSDGEYADFEVKYTFGIKPLQQYLLLLPKGKLQAFTVAWDTEKKQWFNLYPDEKIEPSSPLHWTSRSFTANSSCMECHMTNMALNFDVKTAEYHTTWSEVNVSCQSCHGPGSDHVNWAQDDNKNKNKNTENNANKGLVVNYQEMKPHERVESCARCHSRRYSVSENDAHGRSFFDDFMPELLREGAYHSDGQILDEVYVYGSFVQSKMYQKGVSCMDCHNPHTLKVRTANNGLCVRCHQEKPPAEQFSSLLAKNYDSQSHHFHQPDSKGAQCVNCHMPETTYMEVDPRRDHSFSIPRPDLSEQRGVPNACTQCHRDKANDWAVTAMNQWYGNKWQERPNIAETMSLARSGKAEAITPLTHLIKDSKQPAIVRATALDLLPRYGMVGLKSSLDSLADVSPLVRTIALRGLEKLPQKHKFKEMTALLNDPIQGVRIEAARLFAAIPGHLLTEVEQQQLNKALDEYKAAQMALSDHAEGHLNLGNLYASMGQVESAERAYRTAIDVDAYFSPAYSSLANLYYASGRKKQAEETFRKGLELIPDAGNLHYSLSLLLVEQQQLEDAAEHLKTATELMPNQSQIHYNYGLLLQTLQKMPESEKSLLRAHELSLDDQRVITALIAFYKQQGQQTKADKFIDMYRQVSQ